MMKAEILSRPITSIKTPLHIHEVAQKKQSILFYDAHILRIFIMKNIMKKQLTKYQKLFSMGSFVTEKKDATTNMCDGITVQVLDRFLQKL